MLIKKSWSRSKHDLPDQITNGPGQQLGKFLVAVSSSYMTQHFFFQYGLGPNPKIAKQGHSGHLQLIRTRQSTFQAHKPGNFFL